MEEEEREERGIEEPGADSEPGEKEERLAESEKKVTPEGVAGSVGGGEKREARPSGKRVAPKKFDIRAYRAKGQKKKIGGMATLGIGKKPYNPQVYPVAGLLGFLPAAVMCGLSYERLGKPEKKIFLIISGIVAFFLLAFGCFSAVDFAGKVPSFAFLKFVVPPVCILLGGAGGYLLKKLQSQLYTEYVGCEESGEGGEVAAKTASPVGMIVMGVVLTVIVAVVVVVLPGMEFTTGRQRTENLSNEIERLHKDEKYAEAVERFEELKKVYKRWESSVKMRYILAECYLALGDKKKAYNEVNAVYKLNHTYGDIGKMKYELDMEFRKK